MARRASPLSGPSGGEKLEPEDKAWWHVVDARFESTVDRVPTSEKPRPRLVFIADWPHGHGWKG